MRWIQPRCDGNREDDRSLRHRDDEFEAFRGYPVFLAVVFLIQLSPNHLIYFGLRIFLKSGPGPPVNNGLGRWQ